MRELGVLGGSKRPWQSHTVLWRSPATPLPFTFRARCTRKRRRFLQQPGVVEGKGEGGCGRKDQRCRVWLALCSRCSARFARRPRPPSCGAPWMVTGAYLSSLSYGLNYFNTDSTHLISNELQAWILWSGGTIRWPCRRLSELHLGHGSRLAWRTEAGAWGLLKEALKALVDESGSEAARAAGVAKLTLYDRRADQPPQVVHDIGSLFPA